MANLTYYQKFISKLTEFTGKAGRRFRSIIIFWVSSFYNSNLIQGNQL